MTESSRRPSALVVAYCFPPHAAIGTHRTLRLISHLASDGWHVRVLTVRPKDFLAGTPVDERLLDLIPAGVEVERTRAFRGLSRSWQVLSRFRPRRARPVGAVAGVGATSAPAAAARVGVKQLAEELAAMPDKEVGWLTPAVVRGLWRQRAGRPDVVFSSAPPWTTHLVAWLIASSFSCPWVADFRDPWVRSPWTRYRSRTASRIATWMERRVVERADAVLFTTTTARDAFATHYGPRLAPRFVTVFNGCDPGDMPASPLAATANARVTLLHAGTLYGGRDPMPLLRAIASLRRRRPDVVDGLAVRFLGSSGLPGVDLQGACAAMGIGDLVEFTARVARDESLAAIQSASVLLLLQPGTSMAIPGKLYEYFAAGRPILALCEPGEMADAINDNRLGLAVAATDELAIEEALLRLLTAPAGTWAPAPAHLFDGRLRAAEMAAVLERVCLQREAVASAHSMEPEGRS